LQRIKEYIDYKGITNQNFERKIGFSNGAFATQLKNNRTIGVDKLENILKEFPEISPEWLLTGKGEMLKGNIKSAVLQKPESDTDKKNTAGNKGVPLIPIDAMAGFGAGSFQVMDYDTQMYVIPEFTEMNVDFLIRVKGESMQPEYNSGDVVACKKLHLNDIFFQWNKVYVLDTEQGALIKRIQLGNDKEHIQIISENSDYQPFYLHLSKVYAIALVCGVIRLE
jgi:phage repressor protein C with HTH and peptisase S24 domain